MHRILLDHSATTMNARLPTTAAALSIVGLLAWLASRPPAGARSGPAPSTRADGPERTAFFQERSAGSEVPCAAPLHWRVARVDPEFGMTSEQASAIVQEAATLWEDGTGRDLFVGDPKDGFPIRLVYDDRQERAAERARQLHALDEMRADIEAPRATLAARQERYRAAMADFEARARDLERRVEKHNAAVREWNAADTLPEAQWQELEAAGAALQTERDALEAERGGLDAEQASLRTAQTSLNERIEEHERLADRLEATLPPGEVEAGVYREAVSRQGADVVEVSREIRLYRFTDAGELRLLAAHEMGHALGLGHLDDPTAVMSARAREDAIVSELSGSDIEYFQRVCPTD